jgi:4-hydroxy-tetrahydrodipicolinate reductase
MNLLVLGKGKTGALTAEIARDRGHSVTTVGAAENAGGAALTSDKLRNVDVVLDFTMPEAVVHNITACAHAKKNMVVGTTGWYAHTAKVRELVELSGIGFVYGSNFSIGMNIFLEAVCAAATALRFGYDARIMERHHTQKKDSPSGTAITIQKIMSEIGSPPEPIDIVSVREGDVVGTHAVLLDSEHDTMMLTHDAKSRRGFAEGAVRAAEWIVGKHGFYEFKDIFRELP